MVKMSIKLEGLDNLRKALTGYQKAVEAGTNAGLKNTSVKIARLAKSTVRSSTVRSGISSIQEGNRYGVVTQGVISAYVEFGTGDYAGVLVATYPDEWQKMAEDFKKSGLGRMPSMPYLYPSFKTATAPDELQAEIKKEIDKR